MSRPALTACWEAVNFDRGEAFWGFVLRDDESHVHVYERTATDGAVILVAPSFTRVARVIEHHDR